MNSATADQRGSVAALAAEQRRQKDRGPDHGQDADAGNRAVGRTDQSRHIAAHRRHQKAADQDQGDRKSRDGDGLAAQGRVGAEPPHQCGGDHGGGNRQRDDQVERNIAVGVIAGRQHRTHPHGFRQPGQDWAQGPEQGPDRRHRHGPGADEAHLAAPDAHHEAGKIAMHRRHGGEDGHRAAPGNQNAQDHRHAHRNADQMTGTHQRQGKGKSIAGGAGAQPEETGGAVGRQAHGGSERKSGGGKRAIDHRQQAFLGFRIAGTRCRRPPCSTSAPATPSG